MQNQPISIFSIVEELTLFLDDLFEVGYTKKNPALLANLTQAQVQLLLQKQALDSSSASSQKGGE